MATNAEAQFRVKAQTTPRRVNSTTAYKKKRRSDQFSGNSGARECVFAELAIDKNREPNKSKLDGSWNQITAGPT